MEGIAYYDGYSLKQEYQNQNAYLLNFLFHYKKRSKITAGRLVKL